MELPLSEKDIAEAIGRELKSPIRAYPLTEVGIDQRAFVDTFSGFFEQLDWDPYDVRRLRVEFLKSKFPEAAEQIDRLFRSYYKGETDEHVFSAWIAQLGEAAQADYYAIQPWRRRSVARFQVTSDSMTRQEVPAFKQEVDVEDIRSWPRTFMEAPREHVENDLFLSWLRSIFELVCSVRPDCKHLEITVHFMSVQATIKSPGDNSPEGAHEDGADFIVSALVINRINVTGGQSQILEKVSEDHKEIIFAHTLQPGEFIFQADTGEEKIYGNDLWHHVTPFHIENPDLGPGWRDIIGLDIIVNPE
ncbi:MAG: 2OG-Fe dioxygenase family protein [Bacteroidota bacterium]